MYVSRVGSEKNSMLIYVTGFCGENTLFWKEQISGTERLRATLRAPLSGTFLQTLPELVTPLKGHSSPRSCPPTLSAPSGRFD